MTKRRGFGRFLAVLFMVVVIVEFSFGVQRFPPPEFESGHELPKTITPEPRSDLREYMDVVVLIIALSAASYLAIRSRSRRGLLALGLFSLAYFGFYRKGCTCSIGSLQNVALSIFTDYPVPLTIVLFFAVPLLFTLLFGRTFCASVCPLGAIQDVVVLRPVTVPRWLDRTLGFLPLIYLLAALLFAATGAAFIICQYDPFVSFFRLSGNINILLLGAAMLLIGMFVGRPYCRYLCPYGVLLGWASRFSKWHVNISPNDCVNCRLCEDACPFGSINMPTEQMPLDRKRARKRLATLILILPLIVGITGYGGFLASDKLSSIHARVRLAERIFLENRGEVTGLTEESEAFRATGRSDQELFAEARAIKHEFAVGATVVGVFIGLALGLNLIGQSVRRQRVDYEIDRETCVSCGRCFQHCPVERDRLKRRREG